LCKDPLLNEPGVTKHHLEFGNYTKIIEYSNIDIAVCDIMSKKEGMYLSFFDLFYQNIKENFIKNYDGLIKFIDKKIEATKNKETTIVSGGFYNMTVNVDYVKLKAKITALNPKPMRQI
jgi:hypothetical protein